MSDIRKVIEITYEGETRDLKVTFDVIDRVRRHVPWEKMAMKMGVDPDFAMMAKFIYYNLIEAGFKNVSINDLYDEIWQADNQHGYLQLAHEILLAYQPRGKKKTSSEVKKKRVKKTK